LQLSRAYNHVRDELREVGLLVDGRYLDEIECSTCWVPNRKFWEPSKHGGFFYDEGVDPLNGWAGFRAGTIYVNELAPRSRERGHTLTDIVRHEFGHAWAWRDGPFFRRPWFRDAFGAPYDAPEWEPKREYAAADYVSDYAAGQAKEDFAETFMVFLRDRRELGR